MVWSLLSRLIAALVCSVGNFAVVVLLVGMLRPDVGLGIGVVVSVAGACGRVIVSDS